MSFSIFVIDIDSDIGSRVSIAYSNFPVLMCDQPQVLSVRSLTYFIEFFSQQRNACSLHTYWTFSPIFLYCCVSVTTVHPISGCRVLTSTEYEKTNMSILWISRYLFWIVCKYTSAVHRCYYNSTKYILQFYYTTVLTFSWLASWITYSLIFRQNE